MTSSRQQMEQSLAAEVFCSGVFQLEEKGKE